MLNFTYFPNTQTTFNKSLEAFSLSPIQRQSIRSWRYYDGTAYQPGFGREFPHPYTEWDETIKGPRPIIQPIPKRIVEISAGFLFAEPPQFQAGDPEDDSEESLQKFIDDVIRMNSLNEKWLPEARSAGVEGGTVFKFAWTPQNPNRPVAIHTLSPYEVTFYRDPLDGDVILYARIQFKYRDNDNQWWLYREEWDEQEQRLYRPLATQEGNDNLALQGFIRGEWPLQKTVPNPFGVIPLTPIYNRLIKSAWEGIGDYWDQFDKLDQYNHTAWLEHNSNQLDGDPIIAVLNAQYEGHPAPGELMQLQGANAGLLMVQPTTGIRKEIRQYKLDLRKEIFDACGVDDIDPAAITNKGNLTRAVWEMVFAKSIKTTAEKRRHWGESGLDPFFEKLILGLSNLPDAVRMFPALRKVRPFDKPTYDVTIVWPDLFRTTPEERSETLKDLVMSVQAGFLTRDRAVREAAKVWGITDVSALQEELTEQMDRMDAQDEAQTNAMIAQAENLAKEGAQNQQGANASRA